MSGILRLESLTKGNTLKQGDKTPLKYRLFDADGENLNIAGKSAQVRLVYPDFLTIGYEKDGLTVAQDDTVTFTIDGVIPSRIYHVEIIVDGQFIFPSRADESKFTVDKSSLGTEANIIEIVGVDQIVNTVLGRVDADIGQAVTDINATNEAIQQAEQERVQGYQEIQQIIEDGALSAVPADGSVTLSMLDPITDALNLSPDPLMKDITQYVSSSGNVMDVENVNLNGFNAIKFTNNNPTAEGTITYGRHIDVPIDANKYLGGDIHISISVVEIMRASVSTTNTVFMLSIIPYDTSGSEITGYRQKTNIGILGVNKREYLPPNGTSFVRFRFDILVYAGTEPGDSITIDRVLIQTPSYSSHQHGIGIVEYMKLDERLRAIESADFQKKKLIHLSVDDVNLIFEELEASAYTSMFDHPILSSFKSMHDNYGAVFSLYVFNDTNTFNLTNATDKFKSEWEANSDWLKVGFHALRSNRNYSVYTTFLEDYNTTIANIVRICGRKSLDLVPRIHYYAGTIEAVKAWKNTDYGILGLYSADDNRNSYYHTDVQRDYLQLNDEFYDDLNGIYFIRTDIRLEHYNTSEKLTPQLELVANDESQGDKLTIFTHEPRLYEEPYLSLLEQCCQFAVDNHYNFDFPQNRINTSVII